MDHYLVVSSDGHAGLHAADYRPYVDAKYRDAFDAALPIQIDATERMSDYFLITEINEEWRRGRDEELSGAWDPTARDKVLDDDGIAETRKVTVAGSGYEILKRDGKEENLEVDEHPFVSFSSIRMPHKFFGRAVADLVMDVQLIKSTIQRQLLDNMYNVNNARSAINERVDLDDYLTNRPGGAVRIEGSGPVGDSIMPITTQPLGPAFI